MLRGRLLLPAIIVFSIQRLGIGQIIYEHSPYPSAAQGPASDTAFIDPFGNPSWNLEADDFLLGTSALVRRVGWWGFYGGTFGQGSPNPPMGNETMRVRFYGARAGDGLPDSANIIYEESFLNLPRIWTGRIVGNQREYFFETDFSISTLLLAGHTYWIEIVQVGDVDSYYRWTYSLTDWNGRAYLGPNVNDWTYAPGANLAFQLSAIPEPATFVLLLLAATMTSKRSALRREV